MNERIDELFGKALDEAVPETWTVLNPEQLSRLKTKFAELIVQECVTLADKEAERFSNLDQEYCAMAMDNYRELVRKHFGVEE